MVWVGPLGACLAVSGVGFASHPAHGGTTALNEWTPLLTVVPLGRAGPGEPLETPERSALGVASVAFTSEE